MNQALIVGLGNPGSTYVGTRHNVGFALLDLFAKKHNLTFRNKSKYQGVLAKGEILGSQVWLLEPTTFMNLSGISVAAIAQDLKIAPTETLVIVDDIDLLLGEVRIKKEGGPGTHNGLRSVEEHLQTNQYARLRIGIGGPKVHDLAEFVLSHFSSEETRVLSEVFEKAIQAIEIWLDRGITRAMDFTNRKNPSNPSNGEP